MTQTPSQAEVPCAVDLTVSEQSSETLPNEELFTTVIAPCNDAEPAENPSQKSRPKKSLDSPGLASAKRC